MVIAEVEELIGKGESETVEFKEKFDNEAVETAVAFANTKGGIILIGVFDKGRIKGVEVGRNTIEKITNKIVQSTDPKMYPKISVKEVNDNRIIVIGVEESNLKPCFAFGRAFKRVGKSTVKMGKDKIEKLILERKKVYWDEQIYEEAGLEDIDKEKVEWFLRKAKYERNFDVSEETPVEEASGSLVVTLRKYRISEEELEKLNERQRKVIKHLKVYKRISRSEYAKLTGCSERTAFRDLGELIKNKVVIRKGKSKKTYYELA